MNEASQVLHKVDEIPMLYKRLFGTEVDLWDAIELLPIILRQTGSIAIGTYLLKGTVEDFQLRLPSNFYSVKHLSSAKPLSYYFPYITSDHLVNYRVDQSGNSGEFNIESSNIDNIDSVTNDIYKVNEKVFSSPLGSLIDFENEGNHCLSVNWKTKKVDLLYSGSVVDENGFFMLPEKTLEAVVYYLFYIDVRKRYYMKLVDINMKREAQADMDRKVAQARTPSALSQNEQDMILNRWTSFNRKRYNLQNRV